MSCTHAHATPSRGPPPVPCAPSPATASGAFYMRLVGRPSEVYSYLEPLYNDPRKVRKGRVYCRVYCQVYCHVYCQVHCQVCKASVYMC